MSSIAAIGASPYRGTSSRSARAAHAQRTRKLLELQIVSGVAPNPVGGALRYAPSMLVPYLRDELVELERKLVDLLPVLRDHVYHPEFHGSFSLKVVLPVMVPEAERDRVRRDLLAYCRRDTWAMVKLPAALRREAQ